MEISLIRDMPAVERPRVRLLRAGPDAMKAEELLAIILRTGYRGHGALEVARDILAQHSVSELLTMPFPRLCALRGMGISRAATLRAAGDMRPRRRRMLSRTLRGSRASTRVACPAWMSTSTTS